MKENPSSIRSKNLLAESLRGLMCTKPYEKISIKEITDGAELARMTFYTNFKVKDDILIYYCQKLLLKYKERLTRYEKVDNYIMAFEFFVSWKEQQSFVKSLTYSSTQILMSQAELFISEIVDENNLRPTLQGVENLQKYEWAFVVGGLMNMTAHWIKTDCKESSEEMALAFTAMLKFRC